MLKRRKRENPNADAYHQRLMGVRAEDREELKRWVLSQSPQVLKGELKNLFHCEVSEEKAQATWLCGIRQHESMAKALPVPPSLWVAFMHELIQAGLIQTPSRLMPDSELRKVEQRALTDELTGLFNFRFFQEAIRREVSRALRFRNSMSLLFLDVDHFKKVNDVYGHQSGDLVLSDIAKIISESIREADLACRYGGEEFAIVLPDTGKNGALLLAERIRKAIEASRCRVASGERISVTVSFGVAVYPMNGSTVEELIESADMALYDAKNAGRNCVRLFSGHVQRSKRVKAELPGVLLDETKGIRHPVSVQDVSLSGLLLRTERSLPLGSIVRVELFLQGDALPMNCLTKVVRINEPDERSHYAVGMAILQISPSDQSRFARLVEQSHAVSEI